MKKALVVLLAIAMIFTFATATIAADYSDMANTSKATQDAVNRLSGLGVIDGYTDGTFGPDNNIRRDEFAKIAAIAAGFGSSADAMKNQATGYTDAAAGIWSTGYINIVSAQGYMKGYNGAFSPAANITNAEVLTTVLRMYGYNDNLVGPWPVNYVNQAVKDGLTDDVANFSSAALATRGDVAIMVSAALDENMVEFDKDTETWDDKNYTGAGAKTLFEVAFGGKLVDKVYVVDVTVNGYDADEDMSYTITVWNGDKEATPDYTIDADECTTFNADAKTIVNGANFYELEDEYVSVTYKDATTGNDKAVTITVTSKTIEWTEMERTASKIKIDGKAYDESTVFNGADINFGDVKVYNSKNAGYILNGVAKIDPNGKIYTLLTDREEGYKYNFYTIGVVTKINTVKNKEDLDFNGMNKLVADADTSANQFQNKFKDTVVLKDGKYTNWKALEVGDEVALFAGANIAVVGDYGVEGKVGSFSGWKVNIGDVKVAVNDSAVYVEQSGETYTPSTDADLYKDLYDKTVTYYLNGGNEADLFHYGKSASTTYYGVVMGATTYKAGAFEGNNPYITSLDIFTAEGKTVSYTIDNSEDALNKGWTADATTDIDKNMNDGLASKKVFKGDFVKFTLNANGEIDSLAAGATANEVASATVSKDAYITIGTTTYDFADDAKVFNIKAVDGKLVAEMVAVSDLLKATTVNLTAVTTGADATLVNYYGANAKAAVVPTKDNANEISVLFLEGYGTTSTAKYAIVDSSYTVKENLTEKHYVKFVGDTTAYRVSSLPSADTKLVSYTTENGITTLDPITVDDCTVALRNNGGVEVKTVNGNLVTIEKSGNPAQFYTAATTVYVIEDNGTYTYGTADDVVKGAKVNVIVKDWDHYPTVKDGKDAKLVIIIK